MPFVESIPRGAEGQWWKFVRREKSGLVYVVGGLRFAPQQPGAVDDDDVRTALVLPTGDDVEQAGDLDLQPGLLAALTHRSLGRVLVELDEASGETPHPLAWVQAPADEKHLALVLDEHASSDLVIAEDDQFTGGADTPHASEGLPAFERVTATRAIVQLKNLRQLGIPLADGR